MRKLMTAVLLTVLCAAGLHVVFEEPDKPHTFEITIPAFSELTDFLDSVREAAGELGFSFEPQADPG